MASSATPPAAPAEQANQCWFTPDPGVSTCLETGNFTHNDNEVLSVTNRCSRRIYVRACGGRLQAPDFCAVSGIQPERSWSHTVYGGWQPTGQFSTQWVGSVVPTEDWVCARQAGWQN